MLDAFSSADLTCRRRPEVSRSVRSRVSTSFWATPAPQPVLVGHVKSTQAPVLIAAADSDGFRATFREAWKKFLVFPYRLPAPTCCGPRCIMGALTCSLEPAIRPGIWRCARTSSRKWLSPLLAIARKRTGMSAMVAVAERRET
jgi:hypothetical protein